MSNVWCYLGWIGRTKCANDGTINQDSITQTLNKIGDQKDCDGSIVWCYLLKPLVDFGFGAAKEMCDWLSCSLKTDKSWFDQALGYLLEPVCWLLGYPTLATALIVIGAGLFFLAPFLELAILYKL